MEGVIKLELRRFERRERWREGRITWSSATLLVIFNFLIFIFSSPSSNGTPSNGLPEHKISHCLNPIHVHRFVFTETSESERITKKLKSSHRIGKNEKGGSDKKQVLHDSGERQNLMSKRDWQERERERERGKWEEVYFRKMRKVTNFQS